MFSTPDKIRPEIALAIRLLRKSMPRLRYSADRQKLKFFA
jgi:hypothetical protein